jgi:glycosyltransferase involved in cell wall biosynthesis
MLPLNILIISAWYPMADRLGGDHRFIHLIDGMTANHSVAYLAFSPESQAETYGNQATDAYRAKLAELGITILQPGVRAALSGSRYDVVLFQYSSHALMWHKEVRTFQPQARVVIDNGDVAYRRFFSKAELTGNQDDLDIAEKSKREELSAYRCADAIITVSQDDLGVVQQDIPDIHAFVIPNIHPIPDTSTSIREKHTLLFVGSFLHPPNVDGMVWFVNEVLPIVVREKPEVRLRIVGYGPTPEIQALRSPHVEVVGYVPETAPYLESAYISIAPLRYGAGVKGKIGEAMAYRLPVVTTSIGIDGFGLTPGKNILVSDTAEGFSRHIIQLLDDTQLYEEIAESGFQFIRERFSTQAVNNKIQSMLAALPGLPVKRLHIFQRFEILLDDLLERHVRWRFGGTR